MLPAAHKGTVRKKSNHAADKAACIPASRAGASFLQGAERAAPAGLLRICRQYAPPGVRIAGEIDHKAEEPLTLALSEAVRVDGDITVNWPPWLSSTRSAPG